MKKLIVLCVLLSATVLAADFSGIWTGKSEVVVNGESQPSMVYMTLKQDGSTVTGTAGQSKAEQAPIQKAKVEGDTLTFEIKPSEDAPVVKVVLKMEGDTLRGTAKGDDGSTSVEAKLELTREK